MYGYHGRFLKVDLSSGTCEEMPLSDETMEKYVGGATLAAALIYENTKPGLNPLGPENPLVFATGPFTGTPVPMVSRAAVCAFSPLSGGWGEATTGGRFPFKLKGAGYDGIYITGKSSKPVLLDIGKQGVKLHDADSLWGLDTYQTQKAIRKQLGRKNISIACIGPAGERQLPYAAIMNDRGRAAGRCGMGAVMGAKNLKAVAVSGTARAEVADPEALRALAREAVASIKGNLSAVAMKEYGTMFYMDMAMALGDMPAKYYTRSVFPVEKISGQALRQQYTVTNYACQGCPIGCGREIRDAGEGMERVDGPEYETAGVFGPLCMNFDLASIVRANHLCNVYGIDTISTGASIAYAMHLFEKGSLARENAGMEIQWGDGAAITQLVEMIAEEKGIGKLLSKGTLAMAKELGEDPEDAAQVKGVEIPMHDARAFHGQAISYATGPRGACHLKGDYFNVELGAKIKELGIFPGDRMNSTGKAVAAAKNQSLKDLYDALTICKFSPLKVSTLCNILNAVTGGNATPESLLTAGDRSVNLKRVLNGRMGFGRKDDRVPRIAKEALEDGATAGSAPDMELMLEEYYAHRDWDPKTGMPSRNRLLELGLDQVADDLYAGQQ